MKQYDFLFSDYSIESIHYCGFDFTMITNKRLYLGALRTCCSWGWPGICWSTCRIDKFGGTLRLNHT